MKRSIKSLRDSVNARFDSIESDLNEMDDSIVSMESKMASRPAPAPKTPPVDLMSMGNTPSKTVVDDDDEDDEVVESSGDFKTKNLWAPNWTDGTNYVVGVVCDSVTLKKNGNSYGVRLAHGDTKAKALQSARKIALRSLLTANGHTGAKFQKDDWFDVAESVGITSDVIDSCMTGAVKNRQTCGRSAATLLNKLGITDLASYKDAAVAAVGDSSPAPRRATSTTSTEVATVDPAEVKAVMSDMGMTYTEAKAFLTE